MEKSTSSANKQVIKRILSQEGNNRCADCKTALHPRWASWNIGVLICIRCSGVHRSLGTHISKVRSIDLDTWSDVQLEKLVEFGNIRANAFWEAKLPPNYVPDESKIPSFIKTKYELKRWCGDAQPPQIPPKVRSDSPANLQSPPVPGRGSAASSVHSTASSSTANSTANSAQSSAVDLLGLDFQSAPRGMAVRSVPSPAPSPSPTPSAHKDRNDVKKSILSLYSQSKPASPAPSAAAVQPARFAPAPPPPQPANNPVFTDLDEDVSSVWK